MIHEASVTCAPASPGSRTVSISERVSTAPSTTNVAAKEVSTVSASAATAMPRPAASSCTAALRVFACVRSSPSTSANARLA